jgi:NADPH:quinone reductase-like Zn-dependent oxidoreductase
MALAAGYLAGAMEHRYPVVLGRDFAGTVDAVGTGVTAFQPGDAVFGVVLTQPLHAGSFGEYLVVPQDHNIAPVPTGLPLDTAGVIGLAGAAALASLSAVVPAPGEYVLISGATGGVGAFAIQLAVEAGAKVIATATPGPETDHVLGLGAHHVVDHTGDLAAQVRALAPDGVDVALHYAGDPLVLGPLLGPGGRLASLLMMSPDQYAAAGLTATAVFATPDRPTLETVAESVLSGRVRVPVQRTYDLAGVPRAFADFRAGTLGKLAVSLD